MVTNRETNKKYIGQTVGKLGRRKNEHLCEAIRKRYNSYFHRAIIKYGMCSFDWKILQECDNIEDLNRLEIYYIDLYNTFYDGYNLTLGGGGMIGYIPSKETRRKMSKAGKIKIFSKEQRRKMSESTKGNKNPMFGKSGKESPNYGKKFSIEHRQNMSDAAKGKYFSEKTKQKMSCAKRGMYIGKNNPAARAVIAENQYFETSREAAKTIGVAPNTVYRRIKRGVEGYRYVK